MFNCTDIRIINIFLDEITIYPDSAINDKVLRALFCCRTIERFSILTDGRCHQLNGTKLTFLSCI